MSIFDLDPAGAQQLDEQARLNPLDLSKQHAGFFTGMFKGLGEGIMRGGAKAGSLPALAAEQSGNDYRLSLALANPDTDVLRPLPGPFAPRHDAFDAYHRNVDFWTPGPGEVGTAGNVLGGLGEMVLPLAAGGGNPALLAASDTVGTTLDLERQGVDAQAAVDVGAMQGAAILVGFKLPAAIGRNLTTRLATGVAGNLLVGRATGYGQQARLNASGDTEAAKQFDPWNAQSVVLDVLMGAAFGGLAHLHARGNDAQPVPGVTHAERDAVLTANNADHFANQTMPGAPTTPGAVVAHQRALETAIEQALRGEPVDVAGKVDLGQFELRPELRDQLAPESAAEAPPPVGGEAEILSVADVDAMVARGEIDQAMADRIKGQFHDETTQAAQPEAGQQPASQDHATAAGTVPEPGWMDRTVARNDGGQPVTLFRGSRDASTSAADFQALGAATGHPSASLGVFFTSERGDAANYGAVGDYHLDLRNPKVYDIADLPPLDDAAAASALRERLRAEGHDGIVLDARPYGGPVQYVAFRPEQVIHARAAPDGAAGNRGTPKGIPAQGNTSTVVTERGLQVPVRWAVVDASRLVTSHDDALNVNPDFPTELQPRDRSRAASEQQISRIANAINPELLAESPKASDGAPVVGQDKVVESGNARTIALRRAYAAGKAGAYRAFLLANAERFGLDPAKLDGIKQPVLVRVTEGDYNRSEFARQANESTVAAMSSTEQALADARHLPDMGDLHTRDDGSIDMRASAKFVHGFIEGVGPNERGAMSTADGELSQQGQARIRNAVFARAYGDAELVAMMAEATDANVKNVLAGMLRAAPEVARLREMIAEGGRFGPDITPDLVAAVRKFSQLRRDGTTVAQFEAQGDFFGEGGLSPRARDLLRTVGENARAPKRMAEFLQRYVDAVHVLGDPRQADLLGGGKGDHADAALRQAGEATRAAHDTPAPQAGSLFNAAGRPTEGAKAAPAITPENRAAYEAIAAHPDLHIVDDEGRPVPAAEFLAAADAEAAAARDTTRGIEAAANCLLRNVA